MRNPATRGQGIHAERKINRQGQKLSLPVPEARGQEAADQGQGACHLGCYRAIMALGNPEEEPQAGRAGCRQGYFHLVREEGGWGHSPARATPLGNISQACGLAPWVIPSPQCGSTLRKPDLAGSVPPCLCSGKQPLLLLTLPPAKACPGRASRIWGPVKQILPQAAFLLVLALRSHWV